MGKDFLEGILAHKRRVIQENSGFYDLLKKNPQKAARPHSFQQAVVKSDAITLIAEIKKASPSRGLIRSDFDPVEIAKIYVQNNAAAISVLTEDSCFLGKPEFIRQIRAAVSVPMLAKDFIIDEGQVYEACSNGAAAVLLIAAILDDKALRNLMEAADRLGLDCLTEIHSEHELERACRAGAKIIGVNNRDLRTFDVDLQVCRDIIPKIPRDKVVVAESGFRTHQEIHEAHRIGAHAVLIGETFMASRDVGEKMRELMAGE